MRDLHHQPSNENKIDKVDDRNLRKQFVIDWWPILAIYLVYNLLRITVTNKKIHIRSLYYTEKYLFGWMFNGQIPSFWFADNFQNEVLSVIAAVFYSVHAGVPLILFVVLRYWQKENKKFSEFRFAFIVMLILAFATFVLYPAAAPWYVADYGFNQPTSDVSVGESAAGLRYVDQMLGINYFQWFYGLFNADAYAAIPSMHSGIAVISAYYSIKYFKDDYSAIWLVLIFPIGVWFSAVYLQQHYIIDLLLGALYALLATYITSLKYSYELNYNIVKQFISGIIGD